MNFYDLSSSFLCLKDYLELMYFNDILSIAHKFDSLSQTLMIYSFCFSIDL